VPLVNAHQALFYVTREQDGETCWSWSRATPHRIGVDRRRA
jgi:hypothetical protein